MLSGVLWNVATCSAPAVTATASAFHIVEACTGLPDQERHD